MTPPDAAAAPHPHRARPRPPTRPSPTKWETSVSAPGSSAPRTGLRGGSSCAGACVWPSLRRHRSNVLSANPCAAQNLPRVWPDRSNRSISFRQLRGGAPRPTSRTTCLIHDSARLRVGEAASESDGTPDQNNGLFCPLTGIRPSLGLCPGHCDLLMSFDACWLIWRCSPPSAPGVVVISCRGGYCSLGARPCPVSRLHPRLDTAPVRNPVEMTHPLHVQRDRRLHVSGHQSG